MQSLQLNNIYIQVQSVCDCDCIACTKKQCFFSSTGCLLILVEAPARLVLLLERRELTLLRLLLLNLRKIEPFTQCKLGLTRHLDR